MNIVRSEVFSRSRAIGIAFTVAKKIDGLSNALLHGLSFGKTTEIDHVRAIDSRGHPLESDGYDSYFVNGVDTSPIGPTWREVFETTPPSS